MFWLLLYWITEPKIEISWILQKPLVFFLIIFVYPIFEEIVFRGLVQEQIASRYSGSIGILSIANITTSLLFVVFHFVYHSSVWAIAVFVPSLIFGYFKDKTYRLVVPMVLHVFYNFGYIFIWGV